VEERADQGFVATAASAVGRISPPHPAAARRIDSNSTQTAAADIDVVVDEEFGSAELGEVAVALGLLCDAFPTVCRGELPPIVLRSQLRTKVTDQTLVDRELHRLCRKNTVRAFELLTTGEPRGSDDCFVFTKDYVPLVHNAQRAMPHNKRIFGARMCVCV